MLLKRLLTFVTSLLFISVHLASAVSAQEYPPYTIPQYQFRPMSIIEKKTDFKGTYHTYEDIPYTSKRWFVNSLPPGQERVGIPGITGVRRQSYSLTFAKGEITHTLIADKVIRSSQQEVIEVGTNKVYKVARTDEGEEFQYLRALYVRATSYDHTCLGCNKTTATGRYLTKGIVAVDPRVIPLGTRMYIPGYGWGEAQDVGGAVKGNTIDVAYDDLRYADWSTRWLTIYIID